MSLILALALTGCTLFVTDADDDGYADDVDCDDSDPDIHPDADEVCDDVDNNCDGEIDEDAAVDAVEWWVDADADGFGGSETTLACAAPDGYTDNALDCDDSEGAIHPDAVEICDTLDNDCDDAVDDADDSLDTSTGQVWYLDGDADGYGDDQDPGTAACLAPSADHVTDGTDCDDDDEYVNPGEIEVCDDLDVDEDCSGAADDQDAGVDLSGGTTYFADGDQDGYGDETDAGTLFCDDPSTAETWYSTDSSDCDDAYASVNPGAEEICDNLDNDCDTVVDWGWRVPTDFGSIQAAIGAATGGEHICVEAGTYTENLVLGSVDLTLEGTDGAEYTVLDGGAVDRVANISGGSSALVIDGFTVTNGLASSGAGLYLDSSDATLRDLIVTLNDCDGSSCRGTGIYISGGSPTLALIDITDNLATSTGSIWGVGMYTTGATLTLDNVLVAGNLGIADSYGYSAGLNLRNSSVVTGDNVSVVNNEIESDGVSIGGGIYVYQDTTVDLTNAILAGNQITGDNLYAAGLASSYGSAVSLVNASVVGNNGDGTGTVYGIGLSTLLEGTLSLTNVDVSGNTATSGTVDGTGVVVVEGSAAFAYCNVYGNDVDFSGVTDPTGSDGNLSSAPEYTDVSGADASLWDLTLQSSSALIDAGDPSITDDDGSTSDIGAYGGPGAVDW